MFVASLWGQCDQLVVECRSGQDGTLRRIQSQPLPPAKSGTEIYVVQPVLWNAGSDGWPQLVVTLRSDSSSNRKLSTWLFSTRDGHVRISPRDTTKFASQTPTMIASRICASSITLSRVRCRPVRAYA